MTVVRLTSAAARDLIETIRCYEDRAPHAVPALLDALLSATGRIARFPESGLPGPRATRIVRARGFPFCLVYRPEQGTCVIFAIAHDARLPGWWASRVQENAARWVTATDERAASAPALESQALPS